MNMPEKLVRPRAWASALTLSTALAFVSIAGPATAASAEINLTPFLNNTGIQQDPTQTNADFDGGGYSYSEVGLSLGDPTEGYAGVDPGDQISKGGFTFTWPNRPVGATDNVMAFGQTIPIPASPGATKIGFLGSSAGGSSSGTFTFNYTYTDPSGVVQQQSVAKSVTFSDWTRGLLGDEPLKPNEVVVLKSRWRAITAGAVAPFFFTTPHVFLVTVPLEAGKTLQSIKLPFSSQLHLFGLAIA
jgi:hypothetical protein